MPLLRRIIACLALPIILLTSCCTSVWAGSPTKNVLLLLSGRFIAPLSIEVDAAVRAAFQRSPALNVELYAESLDVARFDAQRYSTVLAAYLREKYADRTLDLIIPVLPQAAWFILKHRTDLFPATPVVYCLVDEGDLADLTPAPNVTGVHIRMPWKETLELALAAHPETQHVAVVAGTDVLAQVYLRNAQAVFRPYEKRLAFTYVTDRTVPQLLTEMASLPPRTVIVYTTLSADGAGQVYINAEVSGRVAWAANAPLYGIHDTYFGRGMTGGYIINNRAHATRAAEVGLQILAGERPENITVGDVPNLPMFDARQLKRWNIPETRLPPGSIIQFREPSLWQQYRLVILVLGVCLLEALLILALLAHRRRRRLAEVKLQENEERLRLAMNAAGLGNWTWDIPKDRIVMRERGREMLAEPPPPEVTYAAFLSMVDREDRARVDTALQEAIRTGNEFEIEYRVPQRDGTVAWMSSRGSCTQKQNGAPVRMTGVSQVITERKRAEEELRAHRERLEEMVRERTAELTIAKEQAEQANQAKSVFLANMSHELRTPLNSILGLTQLMESDKALSRAQRDNVGILGRSGRHLLELIDDLLELSKIEAGQLSAVESTFDLDLFLEDLEEMLRPRAEKKGLQLLFDRAPELPRFIRTDARKLRQVLINLLGNAIKYTERGWVRLRVRLRGPNRFAPEGKPDAWTDASPALGAPPSPRPGGVLEWEIEDTGIGIAPEHLGRIFEPFVQLKPDLAVSEGAGLGLTLSRRFVALLGGEITVRSQVGRGSTFQCDIGVGLPEAPDAYAQAVAPQATGLTPGQPQYRVLVVDDSADNRLVLRQLLERIGFSILEAACGQEAVEAHTSRRPHVILMDLRMPVMDGYEAAKRIREAEAGMGGEDSTTIHTPIIAVTAHALMDGGLSDPSSLFDDVICKPFVATELIDKIGAHLGVEYVYEASGLSGEKRGGDRYAAALTPADLAILPVEWLEKFFQTLRTGWSARLIEMIDEIRPGHPRLARALVELVRTHAYDKLIALAQPALEDTSRG